MIFRERVGASALTSRTNRTTMELEKGLLETLGIKSAVETFPKPDDLMLFRLIRLHVIIMGAGSISKTHIDS